MSLGVGVVLGIIIAAGVVYGIYRLYRALKGIKD